MRKIQYPWYWPLVSFWLKVFVGWKCENCCHPDDSGSGYTLTVHHMDGNPENCEILNLVALCQRCHLHFERYALLAQGWFDFYKPDWLKKRGF